MMSQSLLLRGSQRQGESLVRGDAPFAARPSRWADACQLLAAGAIKHGRRQTECVVIDRKDLLNRCTTLRPLAHDEGTLVVLERGRHALSHTGGFLVDQA